MLWRRMVRDRRKALGAASGNSAAPEPTDRVLTVLDRLSRAVARHVADEVGPLLVELAAQREELATLEAENTHLRALEEENACLHAELAALREPMTPAHRPWWRFW